ncbi:hypothetical protein VTN31DRAFT_6200 [Thermomyces dupontii]|uniref:uncharacterized protein n=1 Tax=Talaromyces thermophilus TaxID=28565 RepID=UPI003743D2FA
MYLDRAAGTVADGYSADKIAELARLCWTGWQRDEARRRKPGAQEAYFRTCVDFLLGHFMLFRGESRRAVELADMFAVTFADEGPTACHPMVINSDNCKTNKFGKVRSMGVMRHKDPLMCTMGQTAFYLFYRWNIFEGAAAHVFASPMLVRHASAPRTRRHPATLLRHRALLARRRLPRRRPGAPRGRSQGAQHAELEGVDVEQIAAQVNGIRTP